MKENRVFFKSVSEKLVFYRLFEFVFQYYEKL